jgi:hypothetical protein
MAEREDVSSLLSPWFWKNGRVNAGQDYIGKARKGELVRAQPVRKD